MASGQVLALSPEDACRDAYSIVYFRYKLKAQTRSQSHQEAFEHARDQWSAFQKRAVQEGGLAAQSAWRFFRRWLLQQGEAQAEARAQDLEKARERFEVFSQNRLELRTAVEQLQENMRAALVTEEWMDQASVRMFFEEAPASWVYSESLVQLGDYDLMRGVSVCSYFDTEALGTFERRDLVEHVSHGLSHPFSLCHWVPFEAIEREDVSEFFSLKAGLVLDAERARQRTQSRWVSPYSEEAQVLALVSEDEEDFIHQMGEGCRLIPPLVQTQ